MKTSTYKNGELVIVKIRNHLSVATTFSQISNINIGSCVVRAILHEEKLDSRPYDWMRTISELYKEKHDYIFYFDKKDIIGYPTEEHLKEHFVDFL